MFEAMRCRDFRVIWAGLTLTNIAYWIQVFALGILVVELANREGTPDLVPLHLGLLGLARAGPGLVMTPVAGAIADQVDRRRVLLAAQTVMAIASSVLALLTVTGAVAIWSVLLAAAVLSGALAFDNPARQSMIPRIVPREVLASAIGLQSASFTTGSVVGPIVAGLFYAPVGVAGLLVINAVAYLAMFVGIRTIAPVPVGGPASRSILSSVSEGARYLAGDRTMRWIMVIAGTVFVMAGPLSGLAPAVTGDRMVGGVSWLGIVMAAMGAGSFVGSFVIMNFRRLRSPGVVLGLAATVNGLALAGFALSFDPMPQLASAFGVGITTTLVAGMGNNMLQATTSDQYRGRVMSVWALLYIGLLPIGQMVLGTLGAIIGIQSALMLGGAVALVAGLYATLRVGALRSWHPSGSTGA